MGLQVLRTVFRSGIALVLISTISSCGGNKKPLLPYYSSPDLTPQWVSEDSVNMMHTVPSFTFTDQDGGPVTNDTFDNKVYVANFFFTSCPGICPKMISNIKIVADSFRNEERVKFISHSVTPELDTVQKLKAYAERYTINTRQWHLVTGNKADIYTLARKGYFADDEIGFNADSSEFLHTERMVLVDANKHIRGVYNGTVQLDALRMIEDIKILLKE